MLILTHLNMKKIGNCKFWSGSFDLNSISISCENNVKFIPFEQTDAEIEILYLVVEDVEDLSASDTKFGKGSHSCKYFCVCCEATCACEFNSDNMLYRTKESIEKQRNIYNDFMENAKTKTEKANVLKISKGIKGHKAPATFTSASRVVPPSMHCGMGLSSHLIDIEQKEMKFLSNESDIDIVIQDEKNKLESFKNKYRKARVELNKKLNDGKTTYKTIAKTCNQLKIKMDRAKNIIPKLIQKKKEVRLCRSGNKTVIEIYQKRMKKCGVNDNKYFKNIEGKQSIKYQKKWNKITRQIKSSSYRKNMKPAMRHFGCLIGKHELKL
eukprot:80461_1